MNQDIAVELLRAALDAEILMLRIRSHRLSVESDDPNVNDYIKASAIKKAEQLLEQVNQGLRAVAG